MEWLRLHNSVQDDPKVMTLPPDVGWFWIQCLICANKSKHRGVLPPIDQIAFQAHWPLEDARAKFAILIDRRLIVPGDGESFMMYKWEEYQKVWDDAAGRMRAVRERAKAAEKAASRRGKKGATTGAVAQPVQNNNKGAKFLAVAQPVQNKIEHVAQEIRLEERREEPPRYPPSENKHTPDQTALLQPGPETPTADPPPKAGPPANPDGIGQCSAAEVERIWTAIRTNYDAAAYPWHAWLQQWCVDYTVHEIVYALLQSADADRPSHYLTVVLKAARAKRGTPEEIKPRGQTKLPDATPRPDLTLVQMGPPRPSMTPEQMARAAAVKLSFQPKRMASEPRPPFVPWDAHPDMRDTVLEPLRQRRKDGTA